MSVSNTPPGPPPPPASGAAHRARRTRSPIGRRVAAVAGGLIVLGGLGIYAAAYAAAGSGVPRGTTVLGIEIGGLSAPEAEAKLARALPSAVTREVTVVAGEKTFTLDASSTGLAVDAERTVAQVEPRGLNPSRLLPKLFGATQAVEPVLAVDDKALTRAVRDMAEKVDQKGREGRVRIVDGVAKPRTAREGRVLQVDQTAAALRKAYESGGSQVLAPVEVDPPSIGTAEVERVMREFAGPAMSGPVTVNLGEGTVSLSPARLDDYLKVRAEGAALVPEVDTDALLKDLTAENRALVTPAKDAGYEFVKGRPTVVPGKDGEEIDPTTFADRFRATLVAPAPRTFAAEVRPVEPDLTTAEAEALGIVEKISTFKTEYPLAEYRVTNIGRAAELMHESLVLPGETWSMNDTVGERTKANGFVDGFIISEGRFDEALGGGVSQSATTVFNAVFFAGLEDIEHHPHSLYISRYPAGREATVAFGSKDLRFRNDSPTGVLIQTKAEAGFIRVTFWGTKRFDKITSESGPRHNFREPDTITSKGEGCVPTSPVTGFDIDVTRVFHSGGREVRRETFSTTYNATDRVICR